MLSVNNCTFKIISFPFIQISGASSGAPGEGVKFADSGEPLGLRQGMKRMSSVIMGTMYGAEARKIVDKTPHDLFVELDELQGEEWVEMSRWIKYEESREEGAERWGKAHISSLSFHSLINLRLCLEKSEFWWFWQIEICPNINIICWPGAPN